jgi:hypothetical protein
MGFGVRKKQKRTQSGPHANTPVAKRLGFRVMIELSGYHKPNRVLKLHCNI